MSLLYFRVILLATIVSISQSRTILNGLTTTNQQVSVSTVQTSTIEYYEVPASGNLLTSEYILFEVEFASADMDTMKLISSNILPFICFQLSADPSITVIDSSMDTLPCQFGSTFSQYARANGRYTTSVSTPSGTYTKVVLAVYSQTTGMTYTVRARAKFSSMSKDICPFNCQTTQSSANCQSRKCVCKDGQLDDDCSINAFRLENDGNNVLFSLPMNGNAVYFYFLAEKTVLSYDQSNALKLTASIASSLQQVCLLLSAWNQQPFTFVPDTEHNINKWFQPSSSKKTYTLPTQLLYDNSFQPQKVVFGIKFTSPTSLSTAVMLSLRRAGDEENESSMLNQILIFFVIPVFGVLLTTWIIISLIKIKYARRIRVVDLTQANSGVNSGSHRAIGMRNNKLTMELIDHYMPAISFQQFQQQQQQQKKKIVNDSCAVCLGEFELEEICRSAICNHFFHKDCLEQWLKKQENCPFCRTDLSKKALIQHSQEQKKKKKDEVSPQKMIIPSAMLDSLQVIHINRQVDAPILRSEQQRISNSAVAAPVDAQQRRVRMTEIVYNQIALNNASRQGGRLSSVDLPQQRDDYGIEEIQLSEVVAPQLPPPSSIPQQINPVEVNPQLLSSSD